MTDVADRERGVGCLCVHMHMWGVCLAVFLRKESTRRKRANLN